MDKYDRMKYLIEQLNIASDAYYGGKSEYMSNYEWDMMFDELTELENAMGVFLPDSPTQTISRSTMGDTRNAIGLKEKHEYAALSLAKTKSITELQAWAGEKNVWLSWKLDGLTLVLTYDNGVLSKILTRGNGEIGTNITYMKEAIEGFPNQIEYKGHLVVRGEVIILYSDFEKMNESLDDGNGKFANPRNLASGTLALDPSNINIVRERNLKFLAFSLVHVDEKIVSWGERMKFLDKQGFATVERVATDADGLGEIIDSWSQRVESGMIDTPVDGLVICYDDTEYAATGNVTGHHATRAGLAFKWKDEVALTMLKYIEWSCAASVITPVAVFSPIRLEGTNVSRASLCNISEMERLGIGGDEKTTLKIIKANKIIPKCVGVVASEGTFIIPKKCPVCHEQTEIQVSVEIKTKTLHCTNQECPAKRLRNFSRFVSRRGMNIEGLSIKTLLLLINKGYVTDYESIYQLRKYERDIRDLEGFGDKSCSNLVNAIEQSKKVSPINFIYSLGIPLIGIDAAKRIVQTIGYEGFVDRICNGYTFEDIDGIGVEKSNAIKKWFDNPRNNYSFSILTQMLQIESENIIEQEEQKCDGLIFVVTGELSIFANRTEFIEYVEKKGGRVTGSVSKKTNYLVNNDINSKSSKNSKAKSLGVPIITEEEFVLRFGR